MCDASDGIRGVPSASVLLDALDVIPAGRSFGVADIAWFESRGERDLDDVLGDIDLIVTGPHASAAFPEEMMPFVDPR